MAKKTKQVCRTFKFKLNTDDYNDHSSSRTDFIRGTKIGIQNRINDFNRINSTKHKLTHYLDTEDSVWIFTIKCFKDKEAAKRFASYNGFELVE